MKIEATESLGGRRTTAEELFNVLRGDIQSLKLVPGTKLSEAEVARHYNVSRQPVREAFIRLDNLSLVKVQPQKATVVKKISISDIVTSRFVRASVEVEVARVACANYRGEKDAEFVENLNQQKMCIEKGDFKGLKKLDYSFHSLMCNVADCDFAFDVITSCKTKVDRLCTIELSKSNGAVHVYDDHFAIFDNLRNNNEDELIKAVRSHLSRLDDTIKMAQLEYADFFEN